MISYIILFIILLFLLFGIYYLYQVINIACGYAAKVMASGVFVANRNQKSIREQELKILKLIPIKVDSEKKEVSTGILGIKRKAVFREGLGCSLLPSIGLKEFPKTKYIPKTHTINHKSEPWPLGDLDAFTEISSPQKEKLNKVIDIAFQEENKKPRKNTRAVLVIQNNKIIAERYANDFDKDSRMAGWSMTKSVTNALAGILVKQGKLDLHKPVKIDAWQNKGDLRSKITLDQLLRMSSGLRFNEIYSRPSDATQMLFLSHSVFDFASKSKLAAAPDTVWNYASGTSNIISGIIRNKFEDYNEYINFPYNELFSKIGMSSALMETDASGTFIGSSFMFATARDWARFGLLYLNDGICNGTRILPYGWVKYSSTRTKCMQEGIYGAHFYCNACKEYIDKHGVSKYYPRVPDDMYYASGFEGNYVVIIPSRKTVIVRLGQTIDKHIFNLGAFLGDILDNIPH